MLLILLSTLQAAANLPTMKYSRNGDDHVVEIGAFDPAMGPAVDADIARRALDLCVGKQVRWGKFALKENLGKVPGAMPLQVKSYRREFSCIAADTRTYAAAPADWTASTSDETDVRKVFAAYYGKRDSGDFAGARAMLRPETRSELASWSEQMRALNGQLGQGSRRLTKVTWYVNPEASDRPGVYAALDFIGTYPGVHLYCGYIILYRLSPADYEIVREEQNTFNRGAEAPNPDHLAAMRVATCRE